MLKLAGMKLTPELMRDNSLDEITNAGLVPEDDWDVINFIGKKVNGITTLYIRTLYFGADKVSSAAGNIADEPVATLPEGWRPDETIIGIWDRWGTAKGAVRLLTTGVFSLTTMSANATLTDGDRVTIFFQWISQNN